MAACKHPAQSSETPVISNAPRTNQPMPPLKGGNSEIGWKLENNRHVRLADFRSKVVVLDFYATWCVPCRESTPHLVELQKRYGAQGLEVVGLNVGGADDYEAVPAFARKFNIPYQLGIPDAEIENTYLGDNDAIPQTFIINRNGELVKQFVGYDESVGEALEQVVKTSLAATDTSRSVH
jgi:thiol-disulfide isomerase/thioredoxin